MTGEHNFQKIKKSSFCYTRFTPKHVTICRGSFYDIARGHCHLLPSFHCLWNGRPLYNCQISAPVKFGKELRTACHRYGHFFEKRCIAREL